MRLENKIVVITGAGSGIGAATAKLMAKEGAHVVIAEINLENAAKIYDEIDSSGGKSTVVETNVSDPVSIKTWRLLRYEVCDTADASTGAR